MQVLLFGQLTDIAGGQQIMMENVLSTDQLVQQINQQYPAMSGIKYIIAVDKKAINSNTVLNNNSTVALLPPFSGG